MSTPGSESSILTPVGYQNNSCGYCGSKTESQSRKRFSYYAQTTSLSAVTYQRLLDRGWRRSGKLIYKPDQRASCCPHYTIRLDSEACRPTRDQRQTVNRFNKFILGDSYIKDAAKLYPLSREQAKKRNTDFDVVERVHESEKKLLKSPPDPAHSLEVTLEPNDYTDEKFKLFANYQRVVHHEPPHKINKTSFKNFLCTSPIPASTATFDGRERKLGSYHQCYRIDGKLVAVGVLDLLPQCVSAVYFMYHEEVHRHGFGKLAAIREIALAKEEGYPWWYAGFYIHSCAKMKYKADYTPQYLLDPESYTWNLLDDTLKSHLDTSKYFSLSAHSHSQPQSNPTPTTTPSSSSLPTSSPPSPSPLPSPAISSLPIFLRPTPIPGLLTLAELQSANLSAIKLQNRNQLFECSDLLNWEESDIADPSSIKGIIAELVSAVGVEVAEGMVVKFG